jgi:hypothetical protein
MVKTPVNPSEDPAKVLAAMDLLFGMDSRTGISSSAGYVEATYVGDKALGKVYEQVRSRRTISVLRRLLRQRREADSTSFLVNKQVAARGVVVLCESEAESPLGAITVQVRTPELDRFIDWMAPEVRRRRRSFGKG